MTPLFGHWEDELDRAAAAGIHVSEAEAPSAANGSGQKIRVGVVERDNGLVMAKTDTIRSSLYDLADQNSTTHTVLLPHGTVLKLAAATAPNVGSYRARFEVSNPKLGKMVEAKGASDAAEIANQIDLLALAKVDKNALAKVTEMHERGEADELMVELGLREAAPLREDHIHVSGYVTKSGRHVGAYQQIRKTLRKLDHGDTAHFPEGITVKKIKPDSGPAAFEMKHPSGMVSRFAGEASATSIVASRSAKSTHEKSLGGKTSHSGVETSQAVSKLTADNPKLPGTPHPEAVAARAKKARAGAKLPPKKERERREFVAGLKEGDRFRVGDTEYEFLKRFSGTSTFSARDVKTGDAKPFEGNAHGVQPVKAGKSAGRRARDESPMPGVIRKPSESDAIRAGEHLPGGGRRRGGEKIPPPKSGLGWNPNDPPDQQARDMAPANHPDPKEWAEMHGELVKGKSLKVDGLWAAKAHAVSKGDHTMSDRIDRTIRQAEGRSSKSSKLAPAKGGDGRRSTTLNPPAQKANTDGLANMGIIGRPHSTPKSGRRGGPGAVDDPNGSKIRAASTDPETFATELKSWDEAELRREAKAMPNSSPLYKLITAELRRKTTGGHPAAKARNRHQGLAESHSFISR